MRRPTPGRTIADNRTAMSSLRWLGMILVMVTGALTAYYTTVYGIRLTVAEKADRQTVERIDNRLVEIETLLRTDVAHTSDITAFRETVERRLTRIETLLGECSSAP